ncbi:hypothetical protein U1Q18_034587 [Sarracenia purpurea var. burkii]
MIRSGLHPPLSIIEILGVTEGIVSEGLRKANVISAEELSELGPDLVEDMSPATLVLAAKNGGLFFVHLQICGESWLSGKHPGAAPVPPFPKGTAGVVAHGGEGFGSAKRP